jgi:tRNA pseudouridine38-40 synthase
MTKRIPMSGPPPRIALCLQYDGGAFHGWQRQRNAPACRKPWRARPSAAWIPRARPHVAAGRTDTGVHAAAQVVHFDCAGPIPAQRWPKALNGRCPDAAGAAAAQVADHWHACFSATYRRYRYTIYNGQRPNLFLAPWCWHRYRCASTRP